jgi:hypothetical protein
VRIHVGNPEVMAELMRYFDEQADCVVLQVGANELEVSLLGSYRGDRHDAAVERKLAVFWSESNGRREPVGARRVNGNGEPRPGPAAA